MVNLNFVFQLIKKLAEIGKNNRSIPTLCRVEPFKHYFSKTGRIKYNELDEHDGKYTRREILTRYLLVNVVLDQGPDPVGVGKLLRNVANHLYRQEIRIFHKPIDFFKELGISIDEILKHHGSIRNVRAKAWAEENETIPSRYNLFFAQSMRGIIPTKQVLDYTIHRWGVPLCVPLLLERDLRIKRIESAQPLIDYLESWSSAEIMSRELKNNERYGLGNAIGDKACHLFTKIYVSVFKLVKHKIKDIGWTGISYESPFDSNVGRVLFRTGFLLEWASLKDYEDWDVIQKREGRTHYIRVTNIRGKRTPQISRNSDLFISYVDIISNYLKVGQSPRSVEIQRIPSLLIYELAKKGYIYSIADLDDGLMYIGTNYCFNHENPRCARCPIRKLCKGYNEKRRLIKNYNT